MGGAANSQRLVAARPAPQVTKTAGGEARRTGSKELPLATRNGSSRSPAGSTPNRQQRATARDAQRVIKTAGKGSKPNRQRRIAARDAQQVIKNAGRGSTPNRQRRIAARPAQRIIKIAGGKDAEQAAKSYRSRRTTGHQDRRQGKRSKQAAISCRSRRTAGHQDRRKGSTPNRQRRAIALHTQQVTKIAGGEERQTGSEELPLATHNRSPRPPAEEARRTGSEELPLTTHNRSPRSPAGKHAKQAVKSCRSRRTAGHQERRKGSTPNGQRRIAARPAQQIIKIDGRGTSAEQTAKSYRSPHTQQVTKIAGGEGAASRR